jgi:hypothetical protein
MFFGTPASGWAFGVDIINYEKANLTPLGYYYRFVLEICIHRQGLLRVNVLEIQESWQQLVGLVMACVFLTREERRLDAVPSSGEFDTQHLLRRT